MILKKIFGVVMVWGLSAAACAGVFSENKFYLGAEGATVLSGTRQVRPDYSHPYDYDWRLDTYYSEDEWDDNSSLSRAMYGAVVGYRCSPETAFELSYNYRGKFTYSVNNTLPDPTDINNSVGGYIDEIKAKTLMFTGKLSPWTIGKVVPFVTTGIGFSQNTLGDMVLQSMTIESPNPFKAIQRGDTVNAFAWHVGIGTEYNFNKHVALTLGYRFVDLGKFSATDHIEGSAMVWDGQEYVVEEINGTVTPFEIKNFYVHEFYSGINIKF